MIKFLRKLKTSFILGAKKSFGFLKKHVWFQCILIGLVLNFVIEALHRHSALEVFTHIFNNPLAFLFNALIITTVMSVCTLFKNRCFFTLLVTAVWLGFGIANSILLTLRITPLEWSDLSVFKPELFSVYIGTAATVVIAVAIFSALVGLVVLFIKGPKSKVNYLKNGAYTLIFSVVLAISLFGFRHSGILLSEHVRNIATAYSDYGFNYCFMCSMFDLGVDKPSQYDKIDVGKIVDKIEGYAEEKPVKADPAAENLTENPNVIFLQLETFFDVNHLANVNFSQNPLPNFSMLQEKYSSGYITVPSIGGGTANTEFEIISGMSLEYFGVGEYPYKTILQTEPCESVCYNLKKYGYSAHALHNNTAVFYDRNRVFANLGFDTFTSVEYMNGYELTETGWAKDKVLVSYINDALNSTENSDVIYTITVQSHGKYLSDYENELPISVTGRYKDETTRKSFEYYVNLLNEVDTFVGDLIESLKARDEKTVLVIYGDHLPSFPITDEDLQSGDLFKTEYVIWDNFGMSKIDGDLSTYQLSANVLGRLGFNDGLLTKLHQSGSDKSEYSRWLEVLEYDMLYGERFAFGGKENYPYTATELQMGINKIAITDVRSDSVGTLSVLGENFTAHSKIFINGSKEDTIYKSENELIVNDVTLNAGDQISVAQVDKENTALTFTNTYIVGGTSDSPTFSAAPSDIIYKKRGLKTSTAIAIIAASVAVISISVLLTVSIMKKKKEQNKA